MYTNVPKPTGANYTGVNTAKPTYDEISLFYDDPSIFYDGINTAAYTKIAKPTGTGYTNISKPT